MIGDRTDGIKKMAEALARELEAAPALIRRTWTAIESNCGRGRFELVASGLDNVRFYIERSKTYGRLTLSMTMPEEYWPHEPQQKERPEITIAAHREPSSAARYVLSALVMPALEYAGETENRKEATERAMREREENAAYIVGESKGLLRIRGEQSGPNRWRSTVPVTCNVYDKNNLSIEGQIDRERAALTFEGLTIEEAAQMMRLLGAMRAARESGQEGEVDAADWLAELAA
jgi:hypothetical protein